MIVPFDVLTTARSGERAGAAGAGWLTCSTDFGFEHPVSSALADAARTVYPNSLRLKPTGALLVCGEGPHVPHPPELQLPHVLLDVPITLSGFSIAFPFREGGSLVPRPLKQRLLRRRLGSERMASQVLSIPGGTSSYRK